MHGDDLRQDPVDHDGRDDLGSHPAVELEHLVEVGIVEGAQTVVLDDLASLDDLPDDRLLGHVRSFHVSDRLDAVGERLAHNREEGARSILSQRDPARSRGAEQLLHDGLELVHHFVGCH